MQGAGTGSDFVFLGDLSHEIEYRDVTGRMTGPDDPTRGETPAAVGYERVNSALHTRDETPRTTPPNELASMSLVALVTRGGRPQDGDDRSSP